MSETRLYEVYETDDQNLCDLLRDAALCTIRLELHSDQVILRIGAKDFRDFFFDRKTGNVDKGILFAGPGGDSE